MSHEVTLPDSGKTVKIRKVSPLLFIQLRKDFPAPKPPKNKVTDMDGREVMEENLADPNYLQALEDYNAAIEVRMGKLIYKRGVDVEVDQAALQELKDFYKTEFGKELTGDDKEMYVQYVLIQSQKDYDALTNAVLDISQPTKEDMAAATHSFPGKV